MAEPDDTPRPPDRPPLPSAPPLGSPSYGTRWRDLAPRWLVPVLLAGVDITLMLIGLSTGLASVSRSVEWILAAIAAATAWAAVAISLPRLMWARPRKPRLSANRLVRSVQRGVLAAVRPRPRVAGTLAMAGLAFALAVAVVRQGPSGQTPRGNGGASNPGQTGAATPPIKLTPDERKALARDASRVQRDGHGDLAAPILTLLGTGGVIGAGLLTQATSTLERGGEAGIEAASTLFSAAIRARAQVSVTPTLHVDHPTVALGGLHLDFAAKAPPPRPATTVNVRRGAFSLGTIQLNRFFIRQRSRSLPHTP
jgi:hypothetical protein